MGRVRGARIPGSIVILITALAAATASAQIIPPLVNQPPSVSLTAPSDGAAFVSPSRIVVRASAADVDGVITAVEFYAGSTRIGVDVTKPYRIAWNNPPVGTYSLTAVAHDSGGATTTSMGHSVTVTAANQAPAVSLTTPVEGATFMAPATVAMAASASDSDGTVARVDFYAGATLIGSDTASPFSVTWNNVTAGNYSLTAIALDNAGATTTSAVVNITVNPGANQAPSVSLTAPANDATFSSPATISVSATASDSDGTITSVEFYADGTTLIGSDTTSPYGMTWNNVPAGTYQLTAVARDNSEGMTVSAARSVTVSDPAIAGRAVFTASADHDTNVDYYVVEIFPQGANPQTANAIAAQNIGKPPVVSGECEADIRSTVQSLAPGTYIATVTAFNAQGSAQSTASAPFTR